MTPVNSALDTARRPASRPRFSGPSFWGKTLAGLVAWALLLGLGCFLALFALLGMRHALWSLIAFSVGAGVCAWLGRPRGWGSVRSLVGGLVGLMAVAGVLARGPSRAELTTEGEALVQALEDYRARTGGYQNDFAEANASRRWNRFGGWRYESRNAGASFHLWCGDYTKDDFVLFWYPEVGNWDWDT